MNPTHDPLLLASELRKIAADLPFISPSMTVERIHRLSDRLAPPPPSSHSIPASWQNFLNQSWNGRSA